MTDIADDVFDPENQIDGVAVLHPPTVDLGPQRKLAGVGHFVGGDHPRPDRPEGVGTLAFGPLPAAFHLKFALRDIVDDAIPGDVLGRVMNGEVAGDAADNDAELDL